MRMQHLFASAAIAAVVAFTTPAQAQLLGGGARGGLNGALGGSFGRGGANLGGDLNGQAGGTLRGRDAGHSSHASRDGRAASAATGDVERGGLKAAGQAQQTLRADAAATRHDVKGVETPTRQAADATATAAASVADRASGQGEAQLGAARSAVAADGTAAVNGSGRTATSFEHSHVTPAPSAAARSTHAGSDTRSAPAARTAMPRTSGARSSGQDTSRGGEPPKPASPIASADTSVSASADASAKTAAHE